jgi:1,5-anhydro-D-fructose reductase (1,5-anhydro-D-mannitol-forming)
VTVRIAAVGYGDIAQRRHFPQVAELGGRAELVALAGRDEARMAACAARFGVSRWSTDVASVVSDPGVDAVLVLTAPDTHAEFARMAARAGKHVLVEKPLVPTLDEAALLSAVVRETPVTFMALPFSETADHVLAAGLIAQGAIGEVSAVECHRGHKGPTHAGWFYDKAQAGGGVLADLGIYHLTSIATLFGPASRFTASISTRFATRVMDDGSVVTPDVEDSALVSLVLDSGVAASMHAHWNGSQPHTATRARVLVIGREGSLYFGAADGLVHLWRPGGDGARFGGKDGVFDSYPVRSFRPEGAGKPPSIVAEFVRRIEAGDTSMRSLEIQAHVLEIIARSYAGGAQPVRVSAKF